MTSLAGRLRTTRHPRRAALALPRASADAVVTVAVAAALAALAFVGRGGVAVEANTWLQVALILGGAALAALAIAAPAHTTPAPLHGGGALAGLLVLTLLTAASIIWSLAPADSWIETNRMLSYLGAFVGGVALVRLVPDRWPAVLHGIALAALIVCGWALLTKIFPGAFAENEVFARLRAPFDYWNSVGLTAACGIPPLLWLAARRSGHAAVNALAYPALALLIVCLLLAYSRGALLALVVGLALWFAVVPLRLRGALALLVSGAGALGVTAWAFAQEGLTQDRLDVVARDDAGHELGVLLALMCVVLLATGLAIGFLASTRPPSARMRALAGRGLLGALAAALVAGVLALALAPGGIEGQVSKAWSQLTDPEARTPANTPDRLTATASVRARYWREAMKVYGDSKLIGAGAGAYATARKRYRTGDLDVQHAHGYFVQVLADLGLAGVLASLLAFGAWLVAAARATGLRRRDRGLPFDAERAGLVTLGAVVVVFGAHSLIDWTWFVPANAVVALLAAGWLAGRGPLRDRLGAVRRRDPEARDWPLLARLRAWRPRPWRLGAAAAVLLVAVAASWAVVQPLRAVHAGDAAIERLQIGAFDAAADIARIGTERNPLSVEPLWELAAAHDAAGRRPQALDALQRAVRLQPANAEAWRRLGGYQLGALNEPEEALESLRAAYYLDPHSPDSASAFLEASRRVQTAP